MVSDSSTKLKLAQPKSSQESGCCAGDVLDRRKGEEVGEWKKKIKGPGEEMR